MMTRREQLDVYLADIARLVRFARLVHVADESDRDRDRLEFAMNRMFIVDAVHGPGCQRIYDTRGAIDEAMRKAEEDEAGIKKGKA